MNLMHAFRGDVRRWPYVNENGKKNVKKKSKILKFEKQKRNGLEIWWIATCNKKFGVNPLDGFWEKDVYGRTGEGRPRHDSSSAVQ